MLPLREPKDTAALRRTYRLAFASSVCLAAVGAPLLMEGTVSFVNALAKPDAPDGGLVRGLLLLGVSAIPMLLAWLAWRQTQGLQQSIDQEP